MKTYLLLFARIFVTLLLSFLVFVFISYGSLSPFGGIKGITMLYIPIITVISVALILAFVIKNLLSKCAVKILNLELFLLFAVFSFVLVELLLGLSSPFIIHSFNLKIEHFNLIHLVTLINWPFEPIAWLIVLSAIFTSSLFVYSYLQRIFSKK